jgi:cell division protein FtsQ
MSSSQPLSTRFAQMKIYNQLVRELDSEGAHYSQDLSEVDLSDPDDVKVLTNDPDGEVLVHVGSSNYLDRFKIYVAHLRDWRQQFPKLESVDLRYDRQIIVNPDLRGPEHLPISAKAAKAAIAAGVKPAALVQREAAKTKLAPVAVHPAKFSAPKTAVVKTASLKSPAAKHPAAKARPAAMHRATLHAGTRTPKPTAHRVPTIPGVHNASIATKVQPAGSGKPSPAIAKGQDSR